MSELLVLYCDEPEKIVEHFSALGLEFREIQQGQTGAKYWSCATPQKTFAIHPHLAAYHPAGMSTCIIKFI